MAATEESSSRWALMIGINYYPRDRHLHGSVDDVSDIRAYLEQHSATAIHTSVLTATVPKDHQSTKDPPETPEERPTRANVVKQLRLIINSAKPGDHVLYTSLGMVPNYHPTATLVKLASASWALFFTTMALNRMVDKGLIVTVALDCCFSGAVTRGDRIRAVKYDLSLDFNRAEQERECKEALGIPGRNARIDRDWLVNPEGYTIITACGPHEKAMEVLVNKTQKRGALTHHLLKALKTLAKAVVKLQCATATLTSPSLEHFWAQSHSLLGRFELALHHEASATEDRITAGQMILSNSPDNQQLYNTAKLAYVLSKVVGLASDAAAAALQAGQSPMTALQLLEQGRGIIGASLQDMRSDVQDLARQHPSLAERYRTLQAELDQRAEHVRATDTQSQGSINRRYAAAKEFTELAAEIRKLPGFEDFMLSHTEDEICGASERGQIVVINVSRLRCDALIVSDSQVHTLELHSIALEELERRIKPWTIATSHTLEWLWDTIMSPILNKLDFTDIPTTGKWPHVWWIPTGPLVQLPLHAAGYHRQRGAEAVLDRVVSSYGSSIRNIIRGRRDSSQSSNSNQALLVAMEHTPGHEMLSFANEEVESIDGMVRSMKLESIIPTRTKKEVIRYLSDCTIFHFAGHGLAHTKDPSKSCLLLEDWERDSLKVSDLLDLNLGQRAPFLAYLSACGTGQIKDKTSFDENINLISVFQIAGFRHVIGAAHLRDIG
ncbi:hypothetical protein FCOIX_9302 [Fusarium coicis]|nr:hypothetical protein FCOIX_9302 [Fusarium coicis]